MVGIRSFPIGAKGLFSGAFAVSFREGFYIQLVVFGRDSTVVNDDVASKICLAASRQGQAIWDGQ